MTITPRAAPFIPSRPRVDLPLHWFRDPLYKTIRRLVRPATALTRRKEIRVKMAVPIQIFEELLSELMEGDAEGLLRDQSGRLIPSRITPTLNHFEYMIKKGSITNKLFALDKMDPAPPRTSAPRAPQLAQIGEENVFEKTAAVL